MAADLSSERMNIAISNQARPSKTNNEVNCLNSKAIFDYIIRNKPEKIDLLFKNLPDPYTDMKDIKEFLINENNWVSSELIVILFENAKIIFNDPEVPFKIGYETITKRKFSYIQKFFLSSFSSPSGALKRINQINSQFNTTKVGELIYNDLSRTVIRLHWKRDSILSKDICNYNKGIYAAVPTMWGMPKAEVSEPYCFFKGDPYCQYIISTPKTKAILKQVFSELFTRKSKLFSAMEEIEKDKLHLRKKYNEVNTLNKELKENMARLKAINEASTLLVSIADTDNILQTTMNIIVDDLSYDRAILMLIDKKQEYLEYCYGVGASSELIDKNLRNYRIPLSKQPNIMAKVAREGKPILIDDVKKAGLNPHNLLLNNFQPSSFVICPLVTENGIIGILGADRSVKNKTITSSEVELLSTFVNNMSVTLHKSRLNDEIESSYISTVRALVRAIEEKDPYTRGHSERVAELSVEMAKDLGLTDSMVEFIRIGCLLHDIGKIGISESIVRSPKPLTKSEYNIIKEHPLKGLEILKPISFLNDHLYLIKNHHERYDGKGYPDKLKGEDIPIGAQILCVADAYDAMTSSRPYRKGLPPKQAARRIYEGKGIQFSPQATESFRRIFENKIVNGKLTFNKD